MEKKCIYLPYEGKDEDLVRTALLSLINDFGFSEGWLAVNVIENMENISSYSGLDFLKGLEHNTHLTFNNFTIHRILKSSLPVEGHGWPLLAVHPTEDYFSRLDEIQNISVMIVVPFFINEIDHWIMKHKAINLLDEIQTSQIEDIDPDVKNWIINEFQNLEPSHRLIENKIIFKSEEVFTELYEEGIDYDPRAIKSILIENLGFREIEADIAYRISERIRSGKIHRFGD